MDHPLGCVKFYLSLTEGHRRHFALGAVALLGLNLLDLVPPFALGILIDSITKGNSTWSPLVISIGYVGVFVLQGVIRYPVRVGFVSAAARITGNLRERYAGHLLRIRRSSLTGLSAGELMNRSTSDLGAIEAALSTGLMFFLDCGLHLLIVPFAMLLLNPRLCVYGFLMYPLIPIIAHTMVGRITRASEEVRASYEQLLSKAHENAGAVQTVRAFGLEEREISSFNSAADEYVVKDLLRCRSEALFAGSVQFLIAVSVFMVLLLGGKDAIGGGISTGQFVTFLQYMGMMAWPLSGTAWALVLFRKGELSLRRIEELLGTPALNEEAGESCEEAAAALEIRNLTFRYPGCANPALSDISLSIGAGERVAIIGPTGAGKSTVLDLITRIIDPPPGAVWIGGRDVTTLNLRDHRRRLGVASQEAFLFSGTIRENVCLGSVQGELVEDAANAAQIAGGEFALGLETPVGEKGVSLSGGQRQRVALARTFARRASIVILDDASSAMDGETEEKVFQKLSQQFETATVLFVTQRLRRTCEADRIVFLENGGVVEQGTHEELLRAGGRYAGWVRKQGWLDAIESP